MAMIKRGSTIDKALRGHRRRKKKKKTAAPAKRGASGNGNANGDFTPKFLAQVAELTDSNHHAESHALVARRIGKPRLSKHILAMRAALDDIDLGRLEVSIGDAGREKIMTGMDVLTERVHRALTAEQGKQLSGHW